jgi:hypothetical protein
LRTLRHLKNIRVRLELKGGLFVIEKLLQRFPSNRIMYGSQYPLYTLKSTLLLVEQAEIDDEAKQRIMGMNASREFSCPRTFRTTKGRRWNRMCPEPSPAFFTRSPHAY